MGMKIGLLDLDSNIFLNPAPLAHKKKMESQLLTNTILVHA